MKVAMKFYDKGGRLEKCNCYACSQQQISGVLNAKETPKQKPREDVCPLIFTKSATTLPVIFVLGKR